MILNRWLGLWEVHYEHSGNMVLTIMILTMHCEYQYQ